MHLVFQIDDNPILTRTICGTDTREMMLIFKLPNTRWRWCGKCAKFKDTLGNEALNGRP